MIKNTLRTAGAAFLAVCLASSTASAAKMIQIKGSDTLINMVQRLSEVYMEKNPGKYISITGGGSGTGIAAIINGKCDIANASRTMKAKEITMASVSGIKPKRVVVAIDGLSVIVNEGNPVKKLTVDQIGKIFRGEIDNWKDVGGEDSPISLYGRQSNSGTFDFMVEMILKGDHSPRMKRMNGNSQIVEAINADKTGIGYVGVGYVKTASGVSIVEVASVAGGYYANPLNMDDITSGKYPITRPLNQYISGDPSPDVVDFIKFELSPEGQKIVEEDGFFPVSVSKEYLAHNEKTLGI